VAVGVMGARLLMRGTASEPFPRGGFHHWEKGGNELFPQSFRNPVIRTNTYSLVNFFRKQTYSFRFPELLNKRFRHTFLFAEFFSVDFVKK
jgi:hypothetical protein